MTATGRQMQRPVFGKAPATLPPGRAPPATSYHRPVDLTEAVREHETLFNEAVRSNDYTAFIGTFAEDAIMKFDGVPVGPFKGRDQIAAAYATRPPTDTMTIWSIEEVGPETVLARFDWDNGGSGSMQIRWRDNEVAELAISFDT